MDDLLHRDGDMLAEISACLQGQGDPHKSDPLGNNLLMRMVWQHRFNSFISHVNDKARDFPHVAKSENHRKYINLQNRIGKTAIIIAIENGNISAFHELVRLGADLRIAGLHGNAFDVAFKTYVCELSYESRALRFVNVFEEAGFHLEQPDRKGLRPLMQAVEQGNLAMVTILLKKGCDVNAQCLNEDGPFLYAPIHFSMLGPCPTINLTVLDVLIRAGADIDLADARGRTALIWAVSTRQVAALCLLLRLNCRTNITYTSIDGKKRDVMATALLYSCFWFPQLLLLSGYNKLHRFVNCVQQMERLYATTEREELLGAVRALSRDVTVYEQVLVEVPTPELTWLYAQAQTPRGLEQTCCHVIRQLLGKGYDLVNNVQRLPLPKKLQRYLLLSDLEYYGGTRLELI